MTELDDRILRRVLAAAAPRPDAELEIRYQHRADREAQRLRGRRALVRQLRPLVERARPLRATDVALSNRRTTGADDGVCADRGRVAGAKSQLDALEPDVAVFLATLEPLLADRSRNRGALVAGIDGFVDQRRRTCSNARRALRPAADRLGLRRRVAARRPDASARRASRALRRALGRQARRLRRPGSRPTTRCPAATPDDDRFAALQTAESARHHHARCRSRRWRRPCAATSTTSCTAAFVARRNAFAGARRRHRLRQRLGRRSPPSRPLLPITRSTREPCDVDRRSATAPWPSPRICARRSLGMQPRSTRPQRRHAGPARRARRGGHRAGACRRAAAGRAALLGDAFDLIPEFALAADAGRRLGGTRSPAQHRAARCSQYLTDDGRIDRPVEEWLHGVARVRRRCASSSRPSLLAERVRRAPRRADAGPAPPPARRAAGWRCEFPADHAPRRRPPALHRALRDAVRPRPRRQCGLLLDEWTEVVPGARPRRPASPSTSTGPTTSRPRRCSLVTPATGDGAWHWDDLVGALNETLDLAKKRAVEPAQLDPTAVRALPAGHDHGRDAARHLDHDRARRGQQRARPRGIVHDA